MIKPFAPTMQFNFLYFKKWLSFKYYQTLRQDQKQNHILDQILFWKEKL